MERIVEIPDDVNVTRENGTLKVSGPNGELEREFQHPLMEIDVGDEVTVSTKVERRKMNALAGTWAAHISNMITGVTEGFERKMKIVHVHFPMNVSVEGGELVIKNLLGSQAPRKARIEEGVDVSVEGDDVIVKGNDKEKVGQTVGNIEQASDVSGQRDKRRFYDGIYLVKE